MRDETAEMIWAQNSLEYLHTARTATKDSFNGLMEELKSYRNISNRSWYPECRNIVRSAYHYSIEFCEDKNIPGIKFSSPKNFAEQFDEYRLFMAAMVADLIKLSNSYMEKENEDEPPFLVSEAQRRLEYLLDAAEHVHSRRPNNSTTKIADLKLLGQLCTRFHEAVLALNTHPHNASCWKIENEWDCQYLFRSILAAYFREVRLEEWCPSVAGSSARCEFFIKNLGVMIELKFVRAKSDQRRIKHELLSDFADYGANADVHTVIVLVYDPCSCLPEPAALQTDLSKPTIELNEVRVIISPPR